MTLKALCSTLTHDPYPCFAAPSPVLQNGIMRSSESLWGACANSTLAASGVHEVAAHITAQPFSTVQPAVSADAPNYSSAIWQPTPPNEHGLQAALKYLLTGSGPHAAANNNRELQGRVR